MRQRAAGGALGMIGTMLKTGGTVALSLGALVTAGTMNLVVLSGGPSGPGHLVLRAAAGTTSTTAGAPSHHPAQLTAVDDTTSTTAAHRRAVRHAAGSTTSTDDSTTTTSVKPLAAGSTTSTDDSTTTTSVKPHQPTTTTTRPAGTTTTTTRPSQNPQPSVRVFDVHDAGRVRVHWVKRDHIISATAVPNAGWTLPHVTKQGHDVTLRFSSTTQLVVWHAWVEAGQIKAWIKTYNL